jgi:two-component system phosphate regulon response regulator PhoB
MAKRILVVEDDPQIRKLLGLNISMAGLDVKLTGSVDEAMAWLARERPDLCVLDWTLPGRSGLWLLAWLRQHATHGRCPVIVLSVRADELDQVMALDSGADDFVPKPFSTRELLARIQSQLRCRPREADHESIEIDGLRLLASPNRAFVNGHMLELGPTEFKLLHFLVRNPTRVHSREHLLSQVWGDATELQQRTVDAYVARLRKLLDDAGHFPAIETVRAFGYRYLRRQHG